MFVFLEVREERRGDDDLKRERGLFILPRFDVCSVKFGRKLYL